MNVKICSHCVLPETFPGISFNSDGVCNYCEDFESKKIDFPEVQAQVEQQIQEKIASLEPKQYGIILAFSGGKDSCFALKYLTESFKTKILALTIDNGFLSETARKNCDTVTSRLGVDHIFFKPNSKVMMDIYRTSLNNEIFPVAAYKRASSICNSCIQVINTQIVNYAIAQNIPVIAGGYLGGQIPSETGFMKQNLSFTQVARAHTLEPLKKFFGEEALSYFQQKNPSAVMKDVFILNPMTYLNKSEQSIIESLLPLGWVHPKDTGTSSSNCLLNDYAIKKHLDRWNFHPYVAETAVMVRRGTISREAGLKKLHFKAGDYSQIERDLNRYQ